MQVKFLGFKEAPFRDHITAEIEGKYQSVFIGETVEVPDADGYRLQASGEWEQIKEGSKPAKTAAAPAGANRAILDGKAE